MMATPLTGVQLLDGGGGVAVLSNRVTGVDSSSSSSNGGDSGFNRSSLSESPILRFSRSSKKRFGTSSMRYTARSKAAASTPASASIVGRHSPLRTGASAIPLSARPLTRFSSRLLKDIVLCRSCRTGFLPRHRILILLWFSAQEDEGGPNPNLLRRTTIGNGPLCILWTLKSFCLCSHSGFEVIQHMLQVSLIRFWK